MLNVMDRLWIQHLTAIDDLREGIGLRAYGQRDPADRVQGRGGARCSTSRCRRPIRPEVVYTIYPPARIEPTSARPAAAATNGDRNGPPTRERRYGRPHDQVPR